MENQEKKGWFSRFRKEQPDAKPEDTTPTLGFFFKLLWRNIGKLVTLNLMMLVQFLPLAVALILYFFGDTTPTFDNPLYGPYLGAYLASGSPTAGLMLGLFSSPLNLPYLSGWRLIVAIVLVLFTVVTWGWQNVGATYNLRSLVRREGCFLFSDYFYAIRRNLKQGFLFGLIDFFAIAVLFYDLWYFGTLAENFFHGVMYMVMLVLLVVYMTMRFYIYHMMITFDLSIFKLLKNAFIFALLGVKRNILALLGIAIILGVNIAILIPSLSVGFVIPIVLFFFYFPALSGFMGAYAAFPNIQRYMIDPYQTEGEAEEAPVDEVDEPDEEPVEDEIEE